MVGNATVHISYATSKKCWNGLDSYGEICVHCGCCSKNPIERAKNRLRVAKRHLQEQLDFKDWDSDPKLRKWQEHCQKSWIRHFKKQVKYYTKRVKEVSL